MYKELETRLVNTLKAEYDYVKEHETNIDDKRKKMFDIFHMQQVLLNFDELEPVIADYLNKKARKEKFER